MSRDIPIIFIRRPSTCAVCRRDDKCIATVNVALRRQAKLGTGPGVRRLAAEYSLGLTALRRHRDECLALKSVYQPKPKAKKEDTGE